MLHASGRYEMHTEFYLVGESEGKRLGDLGIDGRVNWILRK
jgi:hypothetical protein